MLVTGRSSSIDKLIAIKYETNSQKAPLLFMIPKLNLLPDFGTKQVQILNGLTRQQIDNLSKKHMNPNRMTMLIAGGKNGFMMGLQAKGSKIIELDVDGNNKEIFQLCKTKYE